MDQIWLYQCMSVVRCNCACRRHSSLHLPLICLLFLAVSELLLWGMDSDFAMLARRPTSPRHGNTCYARMLVQFGLRLRLLRASCLSTRTSHRRREPWPTSWPAFASCAILWRHCVSRLSRTRIWHRCQTPLRRISCAGLCGRLGLGCRRTSRSLCCPCS